MTIDSIQFGVIGGGVMAEAIISRLLQQQIYSPSHILVSEPQLQRREFWKEQYQVAVTTDNNHVISAQEVILLAIKPQVLDVVAEQLTLSSESKQSPLILSILAGVSLERLESVFPGYSIIRVMPNAPATIGEGVSAIARGSQVSALQLQKAQQIFTAVGQLVEVPEYLMDAVTGLSGSGPAYVALMIESLADGGVAAGLPRAIAQKLAIQTVLGTAKLLQESGLHPAEVKDRVSSPGGTTIAGVTELEKGGFRSAVIEAVQAATKRSRELKIKN
ncbi:pyrroline-5-carboxylate reductase [Xenococcus sp. PCC 7305]|uniref:pyrroline-5-carboxylate reductase n=1 Tax=Xenococcus sp. PCC 7305 TaxID=102125 RepID=UPI0002ABA941|nr:pyrroline-5-carboxylate reductase [Xenococcus sp. PCC 7305]ELS03425.1 pyrroline-5-carboxylate reductase [Xenococcus sp. PCC 7305]